MRVARSYSLCADDAQDAVQRALEIYMRRVESLDPATELAWLKVVVKHEALAVRRGRAGVAGEEVDLDAVPAVAQRSVEERLESAERVERSAEVMRRLKRDEARALMLKAEGLSYVEIGERLGWTYTKVNRCITEGRRRFLRLYEELETGAECERLAPELAALAAGHRDAARRCSSSGRTCATARPAGRRCGRSTRLGCGGSRRCCRWARWSRRRGRVVERLRGAPRRGPTAVELHPMERAEHARRGVPAAARRRPGGAAGRALGAERRAALDRAAEPARLGRGGAPAAAELRRGAGRPRGGERRRRPHRLGRRPDRGLRLRRRRGHLLRRNGAAAGPEAGDPGGGEAARSRQAKRCAKRARASPRRDHLARATRPRSEHAQPEPSASPGPEAEEQQPLTGPRPGKPPQPDEFSFETAASRGGLERPRHEHRSDAARPHGRQLRERGAPLPIRADGRRVQRRRQEASSHHDREAASSRPPAPPATRHRGRAGCR